MPEDAEALKVLLVEDHAVTAEQIREVIESVAFPTSVTTVAAESAAIKCADRHSPEVIVLDLQLKEGTGFGVLRHVRDKKDKPIVVVMTSHAREEMREYAFLLGADYFLDKSSDYSKLPLILRLAGNGKRPRSPTEFL